uniref:TFIIS N-terminal domain-containing protein n=1 Tax=Panagrellus redivivus TaxID=6233 RepID=A0A7E4ZU56_PANRE
MTASSVPIVETVRKCIKQLSDGSKIGHALRRLNRLDLTEPVMSETAVGRAVNAFRDHPEHGHLARDLIEKWISIAAEAKGIVMDEPTPSRKRPATDSPANGITAASGLSFAEALKACDAPPVKKMKLCINLTPPAAHTPMPKTSDPTAPISIDSASLEETDNGLFIIERKHGRSKVYSGKQKTSEANASNSMPTMASLLRAPLTCTYQEAESVLQRCTVEQLQRVETLNPGWWQQTEGLWKALCLREFPEATARDTFSWRMSYQRQVEGRENRLASIKNRISMTGDSQPKPVVQLIPANQKKGKEASTSCKAPLLPINGNRASTTLSPPVPRATAPVKARPAPLMAKALKMMKNRHRQ